MQDNTEIDTTLKRILLGPQLGAMLSSILNLNIPQLLSSGPKTVDELAQSTKTIKSKLERVLFALSTKKVFDYIPETSQFKNTPISEIFLNPEFFDSFKLDMAPWMFDLLSAIPECLKQNKTSTEILYNITFNEFLSQNPEFLKQFVDGISGDLQKASYGIVPAISLTNTNKVLEIGGNGGQLSITLAKSYQNFKGTIYSQALYNELTEKKINDNKLSERLKSESGNYMDTVPEGYDAILMAWISAQHNDKDFDKILRHVRNVLHPGDKVYFVEPLLGKAHRFYILLLNNLSD